MDQLSESNTFPSPGWVGIIQCIEGLNRTKSRGREDSSSSCLPIEPGLQSSLPLSWDFHGSPSSQTHRLGLQSTTGFPASPAHKQKIMGLLSLPNHVIQILILPLPPHTFICVQIYVDYTQRDTYTQNHIHVCEFFFSNTRTPKVHMLKS